jgi:broad specificity phosphatase PhoE
MRLRLAPGLTLYFARHGQTLANVQGRFQGRTFDTPLTSLGIQQAHALGKILAREVKAPAELAYVCSPLPRAVTTMEIVLGELGLPNERLRTDDRLMEINLGSWDGLTHAEARAIDPGSYAARESNKGSVRVPGGGENYADVANRAQTWVRELRHDCFAVTHGAFSRILRGLFGDLTWEQMSGLDEPQGCIFKAQGETVTRMDL